MRLSFLLFLMSLALPVGTTSLETARYNRVEPADSDPCTGAGPVLCGRLRVPIGQP